MMSIRCIELVKSALDLLAIDFIEVELGIVKTKGELCERELFDLNEILKEYDLGIIQDRSKILVEQVKVIVYNQLNLSLADISLKQIISNSIGYDYHYIGTLFSKKQGVTLHKFIILSKIEKAKQLLMVNEFNISEIANRLGYSSIAHFSFQFKEITGNTPTAYKKNNTKSGQ